MKPRLVAVLVVLAGAIGVAAVFAGDADDSPGLGGLGLLLVVAALTFGGRSVWRGRQRTQRGAGSGPVG